VNGFPPHRALGRRDLLRLTGICALALAGAGAPAWGKSVPPKVFQVRIENRKVIEPAGPIRVKRGDMVELRWTTDEQVEIHLHGYDRKLTVLPGKPAKMVIQARTAGRFPITSHGWGSHGHGHEALTYLEVHPR
jgi:FtsP/CotA-like multicopper oxidase with cupredoxin domain